VIHMSANKILVEGNRMWNNGRGVSLGGVMVWDQPVADVVIRGNLLFDNTIAGGGKGDGLRVGTSYRVRMYHNTVVNMPTSGIKIGDGDRGPAVDAQIYDNLVVDTAAALDVLLTGTTGLSSDRNLAWNSANTASFKLNGSMKSLSSFQSAARLDATTLVANPLFVDDPRSNDFYTKPGSSARDRAKTSYLSTCGAGPDVGFLESCT